MKLSSPPRPASPLPLRIIHGIIFGGFTAICFVAGWPEVEHLARTQLQPFHAGPPPRPELVLAVFSAALGMAIVLVQGGRGRSAHLAWSLLILGALVLTLWGTREGPLAGRTADSANLKILLMARDLNNQMVDGLQTRGAVSEDKAAWEQALEKLTKGASTPVRTRSFQPLPFRIQTVGSPDALPEDAPPGTLLLYIVSGGVAYEIHPVGISPGGAPWRLRDPKGEPVVFRSAFNPEVREPSRLNPFGGP